MTTDELLDKLPSHIGRNKILDKDGNLLGYSMDKKEGSSILFMFRCCNTLGII